MNIDNLKHIANHKYINFENMIQSLVCELGNRWDVIIEYSHTTKLSSGWTCSIVKYPIDIYELNADTFVSSRHNNPVDAVKEALDDFINYMK